MDSPDRFTFRYTLFRSNGERYFCIYERWTDGREAFFEQAADEIRWSDGRPGNSEMTAVRRRAAELFRNNQQQKPGVWENMTSVITGVGVFALDPGSPEFVENLGIEVADLLAAYGTDSCDERERLFEIVDAHLQGVLESASEYCDQLATQV